MKFLNLMMLTSLSLSTAFANSDFTLPDRALLRALARRQHQQPNGTSLSELGALGLDASHQFLNPRQNTGRCGANYGRCGDNLCCSDYGYCGDSVDHCYPGFDCQPAYGVCGWPRPVATTTSTTVRTTSTSTSTRPTTTSTSSSSSSTTSTSTTSTRSSTSSSFVPNPTGGIITTNGQCGNSTICPGVAGAGWGPCCSQFFWCGSGPEYCGAGCQSAFGLCDDSSPSPPETTTYSTTTTSSTTTSRISTTSTTSTTSTRTSTTTAARPTFTLPPGQVSSRDGRCGNGQNCLGSTYGRCCSQFGWCGDGDQFCPYIVGCQAEFGYCDPPV